MKVLHVPDVDYRTTALTLVDALKQVRAWSKAHPRHVPIMILLELKSEPRKRLPTRPLPFDRQGARGPRRRDPLGLSSRRDRHSRRRSGAHSPPSPRQSRTAAGRAWTRSADRVMFALDNEDQVRDLYLEGHPALQGRLLFASVSESHPAAAWFKINDPVADFDRIRRLVQAGFLVRTRADADTRQARANDTSSATRPSPAAPSSSAQTILWPTLDSRPTACSSPATSSRGPTR